MPWWQLLVRCNMLACGTLLRIEHAIVPIEAGWWDNLGLAETIWCAGKIGCVGG